MFDRFENFGAKLLNNVEMALYLHYKKRFLEKFDGTLTKNK